VSSYKEIIALLDDLTPTEMTSLMGVVAQRLQEFVGVSEPEDEPIEDEEGSRRYLPRLPKLIEWQLVRPMEDKLYVRDMDDKPALLLDGYRVAYNGEPMPINDWAKLMTGWKAVNVYEWVVVERIGQTLDELRREYLRDQGLE